MREPGPKSDEVFNRKVVSLEKFFIENMEEKEYDVVWIKGKFMPCVAKWKRFYGLWLDRDVRTRVITIEKNEVRKELKPIYSEGAKMVKANVKTDDAERATLEIKANAGGFHLALGPMDTSPEATFDLREVGRVRTQLTKKGSKSKAMPRRGETVECRRAILDHEPRSYEELTEVVTFYSTEDIKDYRVEDQGKIVYSIYRWVSPTGGKGPWSRVFRVRVP